MIGCATREFFDKGRLYFLIRRFALC